MQFLQFLHGAGPGGGTSESEMWVACSPINYSHTPSLSSILLLISLDVGLLWMSSGDDIGITLVSVYILYDFADTSVALGQWFRTSLFLRSKKCREILT